MIARVLAGLAFVLWHAAAAAQGFPPGTYLLTISPAGGDDPACSYLRGAEEVVVAEGSAVVRSTLYEALRIELSADGKVTGSGIEKMTGWGASSKFAGKRVPGGYAGEGEGEHSGQFCYATWTFQGPRPPR